MPLPPFGSSLSMATQNHSSRLWAPSIPPINQNEMYKTISMDGILAQVSQLRNGVDCTFAFESNLQPFSGSWSIIFVVQSRDGVKWAVRLPEHFRRSKISDELFRQELEHWQTFVQGNLPLIPRIIGSSLSNDNPIGFPSIAYEWVEGKPLVWDDHEPQH